MANLKTSELRNLEAQPTPPFVSAVEPFRKGQIETSIDAPIAGHLVSTDSLHRAACAVLKFTNSCRSVGTECAYTADWRDFLAFCQGHKLECLPAQPPTVALYLATLAEQGRKSATIMRRKTTISVAHQRSGFSSPCSRSHRIVAETVQGIRRQLGVRQNGKAPITINLLRRILRRLPTNTLSGSRDRAIILTGFAGGLRRSEIAGIRVEHLSRRPQGITVFLPASKTDQEQEGREVELAASCKSKKNPQAQSTCPVQALVHWLKLSSAKNGHIFRHITRGQNLGRPLSPGSIGWIFKRCLTIAGLTSEEAARYGAHSLRAGFATVAYGNGASEIEISRQTGHRTVAMVRKYIGEEQKQRRSAARKLGL